MPYADPEKRREYLRQWKLEHPTEMSDYRRRELATIHLRRATDSEFVAKERVAEARWRARNPEKVAAKNARSYEPLYMYRRDKLLQSKYGIRQSDYDAMLEEQGGVCAICGSPDPGAGRDFFAVDHDHLTGRIRQLLCDLCNNGLGRFHDDPELLQKALEYLLKHHQQISRTA